MHGYLYRGTISYLSTVVIHFKRLSQYTHIFFRISSILYITVISQIKNLYYRRTSKSPNSRTIRSPCFNKFTSEGQEMSPAAVVAESSFVPKWNYTAKRLDNSISTS